MRKRQTILFTLLTFIWTAAFAQTADFTGTTLVGDQVPDPIGFGDFYGDHVASNDDWLIVGAARESIDLDGSGMVDPLAGEANVGAVYIYQRTETGPVFHTKLVGEGNNKNGAGDRFGAGVVLQGNVLFAGAANDNDFPGFIDPLAQDFFFAGQVYVFNHDADLDEWVLVQKLISDEPNSFGSFGARTNSSHMELFSFGEGQDDPTIALIGEVQNGSGIPPVLHVFERKNNSNQWERIQKVNAPSGVIDASFADSVEAVGQFALVNESFIDFPLDPAAVHVYRVNPNGIQATAGALTPVQTLVSPNGPTDANICFTGFGSGMDAAEDIVAIGDPCDDTAGLAAGAVFVYTVDNQGNNDPLSLVQTLTSPNAEPFAFFASNFGTGKQTVTTDGSLILVGTANASFDPGAPPQDDVHMFARDDGDTFSLVDSIPSPAPGFPTFELYGQSVTLLGNNELAIGQMTDPDMLSLKGHVFLFDILP